MLVLTRRLEEKLFFPSIGAYVQVLAIQGGKVRLGIDAPSEILVLRAKGTGQRTREYLARQRVLATDSRRPM